MIITILIYLLYASALTSCPLGSECTQGYAVPCAIGTYSVDGDMSCHPCPAGYQCPSQGTPVICSTNYYSELGVSSCTLCPLGYTCISGLKTKCTSGQFTPSQGAPCQACDANYRCPDGKGQLQCASDEWSTSGSV